MPVLLDIPWKRETVSDGRPKPTETTTYQARIESAMGDRRPVVLNIVEKLVGNLDNRLVMDILR